MKITNAESDLVAQCAAAMALERAGSPGTFRAYCESEFVDAMLAGLFAHSEPLTAAEWEATDSLRGALREAVRP